MFRATGIDEPCRPLAAAGQSEELKHRLQTSDHRLEAGARQAARSAQRWEPASDSLLHSKDPAIRRTILIPGVLACLGVAPIAHAAETYYVDRGSASCSDSGAGTEAQPYCTISAAVAAHGDAANTILVRPGVYPEQVTIGSTAERQGELRIQATGGLVTIDGADDLSDPARWKRVSGDVWVAASVTSGCAQVFADGVGLAASTAAPAALPAGTYRLIAGDGLYLNVGAGHPADHYVRAGQRAHGFLVDRQSAVTIEGFTITRSERNAIRLAGGCRNVTLSRNTVTFARGSGIEVTAGFGMMIASNRVASNGGHGIALLGATATVVDGNESWENAGNGIHVSAGPANRLNRNRIHGNQGCGILFENGAGRCVSTLNRSWSNRGRGFDHSRVTGTTHVSDVAWGNQGDGFALRGGSTGTRVYNSIATGNGRTSGVFNLNVDATSAAGLSSDYNLFWNPIDQPPVQYGGATHSSVTSYAAASGHDAHSLQADPRFVNPAAGDFHLLAGSPAIDNAGSHVAEWPAADAEGGGRKDDPATPNAGAGPVAYADRGALEFSPGDQPPILVAPESVTVTVAHELRVVVHFSDPDGQPGPAPGTTGGVFVELDAEGHAGTSIRADLSRLPAGSNAAFTQDDGDTTGTLTWTPGDDDAGEYAVTFTVSNVLSTSKSTTIIVRNADRAPVVAAPATASVLEGGTVVVSVHAADPDGDALSLTAPGLPQGATFVAGAGDTAGTLTWTPGYDMAGTHTVTFTASNALSGSAQTVITVGNVDRAPVLTVPAQVSSPEQSPFTLTVLAADPDGQPVTSLIADLSGMPQGASFRAAPGNASGTLSWSPGWFSSGQYRATFFAAAGGRSAFQSTTITITNLDRAPQVVAPATASGSETSPITVTVRASDSDGEPISSLTADLSSLPAGNDAVFVAAQGDSVGTLTWTPTYADSGTYSVVFTAANAISGTASTTIHVGNVDRAPSVTAAGAQGPEGSAITLTVHATDIDGDAIASLSAGLQGLPAGNDAVFALGPGNSTGTLTWTPDYDDAGSYTVTFNAANALSAGTSAVITVSNVDRAPTLTVPATVPAAEAATLSLTVHAADPDGDPLSLLSADLSALPAGSGAAFTRGPGDSTGTLTWTPTYADSGRYPVTFRAANVMTGVAETQIVVANTDRAPAVTAPASALVAENSLVTVRVRALDIDGDAITSLTADLSGLPPGNDAVFTADPGDSTGTLIWRPTFEDARSHTVRFIATNATSGTASTVITVTNVDRPPVLTAPVTVSSPEMTPLVITVQASDPDGQPISSLVADLSRMPPGTTFTAAPGNTGGTVSWTPGWFQAGGYSVLFLTAAGGKSAAATTAITITNLDRAPVVSAPATATVSETGALSITVSASDADNEAIASLSPDLSVLPAGHGALWTPEPGNLSGTLTWTPGYADSGTYSIVFTATNAIPGSATTVVSVLNVDRSPVVSAPATTAATEASRLWVSVEATDADGDTMALAADLSGLPASNDAAFAPNPSGTSGTLTWTPTYDDSGSYHVTFTAAAHGLSATTTMVITVANTDRAPVVTVSPELVAPEAARATLVVHAADPDGDAIASLSADLSHLPQGSAFAADPGDTSGTLTLDPGWFDAGAWSVTFTASNALSGSAATAVTITNHDRAPVVTAPAALSGMEAAPLTITVEATDPDGEAISLIADLSGLPAGNDASFVPAQGNGSGTLTWIPTYADSGTYTVSFTAANALSGSAGTTIHVGNVDLAPVVAAPAAASLPEGSPFTLTVHAQDPDGDAIALSADLSALPPGASFTAGPGDSTGTLSWQPGWFDAGAHSVTFRAANALSATAVTALDVTNVDRAPVVLAPATAAAAEASPLTIQVHAADPDGDAIASLTVAGPPAGGDFTFTTDPGDTTGTLVWTPGYDHAGTHDLTFTASNALSGAAGTAVTVANTDRGPVVAAPAAVSALETAPLAFTVHAADPDGDAIASLAALDLPAGAAFAADAGDTSATFTWTPGYADSGRYIVRFVAMNGPATEAFTVITVGNVDRAPVVVVADTASVLEGGALSLTVHAGDPDGDAIASLTADLQGLPAGATFTAGPAYATGTLTWAPTYAEAGSYHVTFTAANQQSVTAGTTIAVINVDRAPLLAAPSALLGAEGTALVVRVHALDPDGDAIASLAALDLPAGATFTADPGDTSGTLAWTPGYDQAGSASVTFTARNALACSATLTIDVSNVDRRPLLAAPAAVTVPENGALTITVHALDLDGEPVALTADLSGLPTGATFTPGAGDTTGTLSWTPDYTHAGSYSVGFTAANALSATATTAITVSNVDRAPVVTVAGSVSVDEATPLVLTLTAADPDGEAIASLSASPLPPGSVFVLGLGNGSGTLTWTPLYTQAGVHNVTFTAANALSGSSSTAITVRNVDLAPVIAAPAAVSVAEGSALSIVVHAADADGQAIILSADLSELPPGASFTPGPGDTTGTLSWTPGHTDAGSYHVSFTAANTQSATATTSITVSNVDRAPVVVAPAAVTVPEAASFTLTVHAADPDGEPLGSLTADLSDLPGATFTPVPGDSAGTLSWAPGYAAAGSYTVRFTASNSLSGSVTTTITVANVDRPPTVQAAATASVIEGNTLTIVAFADDPDGEAIASFSADVSGLPPGHGAVFTPAQGNGQGTFSWTPDNFAAGTYTIRFVALNALSGASSTVITVENGERPPVVTAPSTLVVAEGSPVSLTVTAADPDGDAISSLTANLSGLPASSDAVFTPGPGNTSGTLTWTPGYDDDGSYAVIFTAANGHSGTATTVLSVANTDRVPVVTAPAAATVAEGSTLTLTVDVTDPDGDAIESLAADLSSLPIGSGAVFTPAPGNRSGTLSWTPSYADSGHYAVTFTASNLRIGSATTQVAVTDVYRPFTAGTFFVDGSSPACSNLGPGSESQPYCSMSSAIAAHSGSGTLIIVKPGVYREQVTIPASGASGSPFVIRAEGAGVVIDGADDFTNPSQWVLYSGNVWRASSVGWSPLQVFADGARLVLSNKSPASLPIGTFRATSDGLYVNVGGGNPASHQLRVGHRASGFLLSDRSWVTIDGFAVTGTEDRGIYMDGCDHVTVTRNTVTFANKYGIQATAGSALTIGSNVVGDNNDHGISITTATTGSVLEDNDCYRNSRPSQRAANGIYVHGSSSNIIRRNRLHENQDTGLHFQNGANDNVAYLNRSWNNGDHGYDHLGATGTIHVSDVAYGNYKDGFSIEGGATGTQLYNSIAVDNGLASNEFDLWVDNSSTQGFVSDYNLFWNSNSQPPVKYINTLYTSVAAYSAASNRDQHTLQEDPRFVNAAAGDFHLFAGSPAIDNANSGVPQWPGADAEGHDPADDPQKPNGGVGPVAYADRGALEYRPATLTITPSAGTAPLFVTASAAGSVGPDGTAVSFRFDFGDGTVVGPQAGASATHTYSAGSRTASVTVTDRSGGQSTASAQVVANAPPVAALAATPATGSAPLTVTFDASLSHDSDGPIVSYRFDFGDGVVAGPQSSPVATHSYGTGTWAPIVTITDDKGATGAASTPSAIVVGQPNVPPVAKLAVNPASGKAPLLVSVDASQSSDSDGSVVSYRFDFGDGTILGPQSSPAATHVYETGSWTLVATVIDDDGGTSTTSMAVTVLEHDLGAPHVIAPAVATVAEASALMLTVHAADPDGQPISTLVANLAGLPAGHNAVFTPGAGDTTGTLTWTPTHSDSGSYVVTFTASNDLSGSASTQITVSNVDRAPVVTAPAAMSVSPGALLTIAVTAADPDSDAVGSLSAGLAGLPPGNDAAFAAEPGNTGGTLTWTPAAADTGSYMVTFTAANGLTSTAATAITVSVINHAPLVSVPDTAVAAEGSPFSLTVHVRDEDGEDIHSLDADLGGLPAGGNAAFAAGPGDTVGTLTWTPTYADSGSYTVTFTASNSLSATATTVIAVAAVDRAPVVTAPAAAGGHAGGTITIHVTAVDPDGQAIDSLSAGLVPAANGAVFTPASDHASGTLSWSPALGDTGHYIVTFTARNALPGSAVTALTVTPSNQAPAAVLAVTRVTGNEPLDVLADASGSSDRDGTIVSYRFDFGDGTVIGPQAEPTAAHTYAAGHWTLSVVVTDEEGAVSGASRAIVVAEVESEPNLVTNPSFETGTSGWGPYAGSTIQRVAGGFDGDWCLRMTAPDSLGSFGANDSPNWVTTTPSAGARYRFTAWVRSTTSGGQARLRVREYQGLVRIGATGYFSNTVGLSPLWSMITLDYLAQQAGTTLDLQVEGVPLVRGEQFEVDNVSIRLIQDGPASSAPAPARAETDVFADFHGLHPVVSPNPMRAEAKISFATSRRGPLRAAVFDASGRMVRRIADGAEVAGGWHSITLDGKDDEGRSMGAGIYFYRIVSVDGVATGRMVMLR